MAQGGLKGHITLAQTTATTPNMALIGLEGPSLGSITLTIPEATYITIAQDTAGEHQEIILLADVILILTQAGNLSQMIR